MKPSLRIPYVREHEAELGQFDDTKESSSAGKIQRELDEIGRLLCHASSKEMRDKHPIIGDRRGKKQDQFEQSVTLTGLNGEVGC
jgi:hypothetical protein